MILGPTGLSPARTLQAGIARGGRPKGKHRTKGQPHCPLCRRTLSHGDCLNINCSNYEHPEYRGRP